MKEWTERKRRHREQMGTADGKNETDILHIKNPLK